MDAGGTSIDIRYRVGDTTGALQMPGVNVRRDGIGESAARFASAIRTTLRAAQADSATPASRLVAVIGASGAGDAATCRAIESLIDQALSDDPAVEHSATVMSDAELALIAAHGEDAGAVVVVGTGSVALLREHDGSITQRGGLGFLLGDEGGGYAIGLAAVRFYARHVDQHPRGSDESSEGSLVARLADALGARTRATLIEVVYAPGFHLQKLASVVLEAYADGDPDAATIVERQLDELAVTVSGLNRAPGSNNTKYCLTGGLTTHPKYVDALQRIAIPPTWEHVKSKCTSAADAALLLALAP